MPQKNAAQLTLFEVEEYLKTAPCVRFSVKRSPSGATLAILALRR